MSEGDIYTVPLIATASNGIFTAAVSDIFALAPGAAHGIVLHYIHLDAAVTAEAYVRMRLKRATATYSIGSGGTVITAATRVQSNGNAAATVCHVNDTTQSTTSGAFTTLEEFLWDQALPFEHFPPPEHRYIINSGSCGLVLDFPVAPTGFTAAGKLMFEEIP